MSDIPSDCMQAVSIDRYRIEIEPDFNKNRFRGTVRMEATARGVVSRLELHAVDIEVESCRIAGEPAQEYSVDPETAVLTVVPPRERLEGDLDIEIEYTGELNDRLAGLYRSRMGTGMSAVTQFEERDARRAFPCIDHPSRRSVFDIALVAPAGMIAIANTGAEEIEELDGGRRRFRFRPTPLMPTYLLFFGIGPFEVIEDNGFRVPIRVIGAAGKVEDGRPSIGFARESLEYLEDYTGVEYPLDKLDLIGVPDFAYGAMENFGAISYRENYVYLDESSSQAEREGVASITAHEVAHMWFGDLVSPADWGYVWLNEAFATYFGNVIVDAEHPEWQALPRFVAGAHGGTMERDSLPGTVPIEFAEGTFTEIDPSTAPIIYGKAGAVLHMFRDFLGDEEFKRGVHAYLTAHAYASVGTDAFLESFGVGAGDEVSAMLERWIRTTGFPIVSAHRDGDTVTLEQRRFVLTGEQMPGTWPIPVTVLAAGADGTVTRVSRILDEKRGRIDLPADTAVFKLNAGHAGFYRASYDPPSLEALAASFSSWEPVDRAGLILDLAALFVSGAYELDTVLDFVARTAPGEEHELPLRGFCGLLMRCHTLLPHTRERVSSLLTEILESHYRRLGIEPAGDDTPVDARLRPDVVWWLYRAGYEDARSVLVGLVETVRSGREVPADLLPVVLRVGACEGILGRGWFTERVEDAEVSEARRRHLLSAMGWFSSADDLDAVLDYTMSTVSQHNRHYPVGGATANPEAAERLFPWVRRSVSALAKLHGYAFSRIVSAVIPRAGAGRSDEMRAFVEEELRPLGASGPLDMALEQMTVLERFISRHSAAGADEERS